MLRPSIPGPVFLLLLNAVFASPTFGVEIAPQRYVIGERTPGAYVPCVTTPESDEKDRRITRVLVSIHSSGFDAKLYFQNARLAASKVPGALEETFIVAPQFFQDNIVPGTIPEGLLHWTVSPYRGSSRGAVGPESTPVRISAYDVLDQWLAELADHERFPELEEVVLVGHSAGGQLVQRYAMVGRFEPPRGVECRYVVSAPSSYAYPTPKRLVPGTRKFERPDAETREACPKYDDWGYGLQAPYTYWKDQKTEDVMRRYARRRVYYLCGDRDTNLNDPSLGKTCAANLQGRTRLERMQVFGLCLADTYGRRIERTHAMAIVPGIGHHGRGTMTSPPGLRFLFGSPK